MQRYSANTILKNKVGGLTLPDINSDYTATVIKTVWYLLKNRHIEPWNRMKKPEMDAPPLPAINRVNWSSTKEQRQYNETKTVFSEWCWNKWTSKCKKMNLKTNFTPFMKINSKQIINLIITCRSIKLLEENPGHLRCGDIFIDTPKTWVMKEIIELNFIKIKNCSAIDSTRQVIGWDKTFAKDTCDKGQLSKIYKKFFKLSKN